ncbi:MAG: phytanoyl-CoA dioxygenase family protein [Reinekea sp.]|nr:phytanoyl-CoA dioxygenase family protein [Reinekea sp.]
MNANVGADVDLYPSRHGADCGIQSRYDPIVYGEPDADGVLTQTQLERYQQQGYLVLDNLFNTAEIEHLIDEVSLWQQAFRNSENDNVSIDEHGDIRSFYGIHAQHALYSALSKDTRLVSIAQQVLADDVYLHQSRLTFKAPFVGQSSFWHSDFETWHVEDGLPRMRTLSLALVLTENQLTNAPIMVLPGSHKSFVSCPGETPENNYLLTMREQHAGLPRQDDIQILTDINGVDAISAKKGSVILYDCNLMHGSSNNLSPLPRRNAVFVYNAISNRPRAPFSGMPARPEFMATRRLIQPIRAQHQQLHF